jgi:hypothetical protein
VIDITDPLNIDEVTIADFLKQGCTTRRPTVCASAAVAARRR